MSTWDSMSDHERAQMRDAGRDEGGRHLGPRGPRPTTDLLRFVITAYRDGHERPLVDRTVHATPEMFINAEVMAEDDAELSNLWRSRGWAVTLEVYDPDLGPGAGPVVLVALDAEPSG